MRRVAAMKYRLAGATYRVIAEKLTEERAQAYADEKGYQHRPGDEADQARLDQDSLAEMEDLRRETEV